MDYLCKCGKSCNSESDLNFHMVVTCRFSTDYLCKCGESFKSENTLNFHIIFTNRPMYHAKKNLLPSNKIINKHICECGNICDSIHDLNHHVKLSCKLNSNGPKSSLNTLHFYRNYENNFNIQNIGLNGRVKKRKRNMKYERKKIYRCDCNKIFITKKEFIYHKIKFCPLDDNVS